MAHRGPLPGKYRIPLVDRFWSKVQKIEGGCWLWTAAKNQNGYGIIGDDGRRGNVLAHRAAYRLVKGPLPVSLEPDHLCRNPGCVNPDHLEWVTHAENIRRGHFPPNAASKRTHCIHGHSLSGDNLYLHNGVRNCRACRKERNNGYRARCKNRPQSGTASIFP